MNGKRESIPTSPPIVKKPKDDFSFKRSQMTPKSTQQTIKTTAYVDTIFDSHDAVVAVVSEHDYDKLSFYTMGF